MKLSLIIPTRSSDSEQLSKIFSRAKCLLEKLDYEIIVVSDGKFDPEKINKFDVEESRIKFIFNDTNLGVFESRRKGLMEATGKYVWFVDATDNILNVDITPEYDDYDMIYHNFSFVDNKDVYHNGIPQSNLDNSVDSYKNINPITSKYISKVFINCYISNIIFNREFITKVYKDLPSFENFNKFSGLYLSAVALKHVKNLKYIPSSIYEYNFRDEYIGTDEKHTNCNFFYLNTEVIFTKKQVSKLKKILENDTEGVKEFIMTYVSMLLKTNRVEHDHHDSDDECDCE